MEYNPETIRIIESPDDGSCFFYSVAYQLLELGCKVDYKLEEIRECIRNWNEKLVNNKKIEEEDIVDFSEQLQLYIYKYIKENQWEIIDIGFETTIENGIFIVHGITWEEYLERYRYFAGDEYRYETGEKLDDRWGSTLEQVVLAKMLGINIVVYTPQVYYPTLKQYKSSIFKDGKFQRNTVLNKMSSFNYGENDFTVNLLWKKFYGRGHYMGIDFLKTNQYPTILAFKL